MFNSIPEILFNSVKQYGNKDIFRTKVDGKYQGTTYAEFGDLVTRLAAGISTCGIGYDQKVAILGSSCMDWANIDFALLSIRAVVVPVYPTLSAVQLRYQLEDSDATAIFVDTEAQYKKVMEVFDDLPLLKQVFCFKNLANCDALSVIDLQKRGDELLAKNPSFVKDEIKAIDKEDVCSLVYTSGTTGDPKGVMLTNKGFVTDVVNSEKVLNISKEDTFLSFLPLSHLYERSAGHWDPIYRGCTICYAQSIKTVIEDMKDASPTVMVSVPRLYEKITQSVHEQVQKSSFFKKKVFKWALKVGEKHVVATQAHKKAPFLKLKYKLADKLVFNKIRESLGGRMRCPIAGGSPPAIDTLKMFEAMGMKIAEGYGMTEAHLILTLTDKERSVYGSCGRPIEGLNMKISDEGEILIKGDTVMKGYYKKPEQTAEVIDKDGWLHTGDIGYLDENNYLFITDRMKNIIITSGGKNIAPTPIENAIKASKYVEDICLIGDNRKFISALVIPNMEFLTVAAKENGINFSDQKELCSNDDINQIVMRDIERLQTDFARVEKVKKIVLLSEPLSMEKGELTPSLKIKRKVVAEKYKPQLDLLYAD